MTVNTFYAFLAQKLEAGGSETTIYLDRITTRTGETIATSDFSTFGRGVLTVNPDGDGVSSYPEYISFTAIDSSAVSATGASRGLSAKGNSTVTANKRFHPVGTPVVISFGAHQIQDLVDYVDDQVAATVVGTSNAVTATAGETISSAPALVYLKNDGKWWLTDADTVATMEGVQLGVALSAVSADASITNGVVRKGLVPGFSGLVAGTTYYVSNTAGGISTSAGTNSKRVGVAKSTTELYFDPEYYEIPTGNEKSFLTGVVGMVLPYAGSSAPSGFLLCNGQAVSRTTYADLFAVTSTSYGAGDGSTTFNVPDLRGRVIAGLDNLGGSSADTVTDTSADTLGGTHGTETHTLTTDEIPAHTHGPGGSLTSFYGALSGGGSNMSGTSSGGGATGTTGSTGGGTAHENMQPTMFMSYIIKT